MVTKGNSSVRAIAKFDTEREGQLDFYSRFLPLIDPNLKIEDVLADNNDGVLNGNLLEFKLRVNDLNAVVFQCIKYLSALRIKGKPIPANMLAIDLSTATAYLYKSSDYLEHIERVYSGGASKNDGGFVAGAYDAKYEYGASQLDAVNLIKVLKSDEYTRIHLDENCIVGWATSFYTNVPNARKEDFLGDETGQHKTIGEIRNPSIFKRFIYPYDQASNVKFEYLMDKLNDDLQKKNLGAFYTPEVYARKSHELLREAISRVPNGHDYVIIDRCAGTGNLEKNLTDEELSHCILSTVEYYEYKVLQEILGSKVRHIIPPVEEHDTFQAGLVRGADALSEEYVNSEIIKPYIDNPNCTIILFENPPFAETTSIEHQKRGAGKKSSTWKNSYVVQEMREALHGMNTNGRPQNDLGNAFIWSAFKYYLRQPTDSYVVYSPVKYWKAQHLINKRFIDGFAFNRRWFHANIDACIMVALWSNEDANIDGIAIDGYDYDQKTDSLIPVGPLKINRVHTYMSDTYFDKEPYKGDVKGLVSNLDGTERTSGTILMQNPIYNDNIIGYLTIRGVNFDNPDLNCSLLSVGRYDQGGFYLRKERYLEKLPMFAAGRYITYNRAWTERARVMKSGDGAERFNADVANGKLSQFLLKCLLFTSVETQNHMRTFTGSDGHFYRNELCLDTTNGETIASRDLKALNLNKTEQRILQQWNVLLEATKQTSEYNPTLTYGVYQISKEIDTSYKDESGNTVWNNVEVHSALKTLKALVKDYYNTEIVPTLFKYEFLK